MRPPNIVYLHSHDTGRYVQPYGHQIPTPNIQRLADQGLLFRQAFCAAPSLLGQPRVPADRPVGARQRDDGPRAPRLDARRLRPPHRPPAARGRLLVGAHRRAAPLRRPGRARLRPRRRHRHHEGPLDRAGGPAAASQPAAAAVLPARSGSSRPTASSSSPARCATRCTARRRRTCPTRPRPAPTWPPSRPARARSTRASARSCTALDEQGLADDTLVVLTTDHGLPVPGREGAR